MCNFLFLNKKALKKAEDQEEIEVMVKGTFVEEDGERKLMVTEVDGYPVEDLYEEESPCEAHEKEMSMDSEDALMLFIQKPKRIK